MPSLLITFFHFAEKIHSENILKTCKSSLQSDPARRKYLLIKSKQPIQGSSMWRKQHLLAQVIAPLRVMDCMIFI